MKGVCSRFSVGLFLLCPMLLHAYPDGPPPAHTGGFGEPTCRACHAGGEPDADGGLSVTGLPDTYEPGEIYPVVISLRDRRMAVAGVELSARWLEGEAAGRNAGRLQPVDERLELSRDDGVHYLSHGLAGIALQDKGEARWVLSWQAPAEMAGPVVWHVSAVAGNDDASEFGDSVYTHSRRLPPGE